MRNLVGLLALYLGLAGHTPTAPAAKRTVALGPDSPPNPTKGLKDLFKPFKRNTGVKCCQCSKHLTGAKYCTCGHRTRAPQGKDGCCLAAWRNE